MIIKMTGEAVDICEDANGPSQVIAFEDIPIASAGCGELHDSVPDGGDGDPEPIAVEFPQVAASTLVSCGILDNQSLVCWGEDLEVFALDVPPAGQFKNVSLSTHGYHGCAVTTSGDVLCWGRNNFGQAAPPTGVFQQVVTGLWHSCGLRSDGSVECWGANDVGQSDAPQGVFRYIAAGGLAEDQGHSCGILEDGSLQCWGSNTEGQADDVAGSFLKVALGDAVTLTLSEDGTLQGFGADVWAPAGEYRDIAAGGGGGRCAIASGGALTCVGGGASAFPAGQFREVTLGGNLGCAITDSGTFACWGDDISGGASPP